MTDEQIYKEALKRIIKRGWELPPNNDTTELMQIAEQALRLNAPIRHDLRGADIVKASEQAKTEADKKIEQWWKRTQMRKPSWPFG